MPTCVACVCCHALEAIHHQPSRVCLPAPCTAPPCQCHVPPQPTVLLHTCVVCVCCHALETIHQHLLKACQGGTQALTASSNTNLINHSTAQHTYRRRVSKDPHQHQHVSTGHKAVRSTLPSYACSLAEAAPVEMPVALPVCITYQTLTHASTTCSLSKPTAAVKLQHTQPVTSHAKHQLCLV